VFASGGLRGFREEREEKEVVIGVGFFFGPGVEIGDEKGSELVSSKSVSVPERHIKIGVSS
jgi:hypothetical protein